MSASYFSTHQKLLIQHRSVVESTMPWAEEVASSCNLQIPTLCIADQQTHGRGRHGRKWISPQGNFCGTFILPLCSVEDISRYSLMVGLAVRDVIADYLPPVETVQCKWPNDVLINQKKTAGFLLQPTSTGQNNHMLIGVGINLCHHPSDTLFPSSDLSIFTSTARDPIQVGMDVFQSINNNLKTWSLDGFEQLHHRWKEHAWRMKKSIAIRNQDKTVVGIFDDIDESAALIIKDEQQRYHRFLTGDVFKE